MDAQNLSGIICGQDRMAIAQNRHSPLRVHLFKDNMTTDLYTRNPSSIVFYGTSWCGDCRRAQRVFSQIGIPFTEVDIDADEQAEAFVKELNRGYRSVPTIVFPDGTVLIEPDDGKLLEKLKGL
jgi:mycoredoxin